MELNLSGIEGKAEIQRFIFISLTILLILTIVILNYPNVNCDVAIFIEASRMLLEGKLLYQEIVDVNLPLIIYFHTISELVSNKIGYNSIVIFNIFVFSCMLACLLSIIYILRKIKSLPKYYINILTVVWFSITLSFAIDNTYGEREHIFILLSSPFFILRMLRWMGVSFKKWASILVGMIAAVGMLLKPHFIVIGILPELFFLIWKRDLKNILLPEVLAAITIVTIYILHFLFLPSAVNTALLNIWMPLVNKYYYFDRVPLTQMLLKTPTLLFAMMMSTILLVRLKSMEREMKTVTIYLLLLCLGSAIIFLGQGKGWIYHAIPLRFFTVLSMLLVVHVIFTKGHIYEFIKDMRKTKYLTNYCKNPLCLFLISLTLFALQNAYWIYMNKNHLEVFFKTINTSVLLAFIFIIVFHALRRRLYLVNAFMLATLIGVILLARPTNAINIMIEKSEVAQIITSLSKDQDRVVVIGPELPYPTLTVLKRRTGTRYLGTTWPLIFSYGITRDHPQNNFPYHDLANAPYTERLYVQQLAEDIQVYRPRLFIVSKENLVYGFNPDNYFKHIGFYPLHLKDYSLKGMDGYTVYVRN